MPLTCNIDSRGKRARFVYGVVMLAIAIAVLLIFAIPTGSLWPWLVVIACTLGGAFAIFEAWAGWCAVRAMGFKTRM